MNIIAAAALVAAEHDEDQAFRLFAWLMRSHTFLFGGTGLVGARVECRALRLLLEARNPELWLGERTLSDAIEMCASQWMLSLWVGVLPLDGVWEVWRLLLAEAETAEAPPATNLRVAVALLEAAAPTVARALADDAAAAAECAEVEAGAGGGRIRTRRFLARRRRRRHWRLVALRRARRGGGARRARAGARRDRRRRGSEGGAAAAAADRVADHNCRRARRVAARRWVAGSSSSR